MSGLWMAGVGTSVASNQAASAANARARQASDRAANLQARVTELEHQVGRLALLNQALWELLRDKAHLTDADLEKRAHDVDMRDGCEDGQMTAQPVRCPNCGRVSNSKHHKCLYCGQLFAKPMFG